MLYPISIHEYIKVSVGSDFDEVAVRKKSLASIFFVLYANMLLPLTSQEYAFFEAIDKKDVITVDALIKAGVDVNVTYPQSGAVQYQGISRMDLNGTTLGWAIGPLDKQKEIVGLLIEAGVIITVEALLQALQHDIQSNSTLFGFMLEKIKKVEIVPALDAPHILKLFLMIMENYEFAGHISKLVAFVDPNISYAHVRNIYEEMLLKLNNGEVFSPAARESFLILLDYVDNDHLTTKGQTLLLYAVSIFEKSAKPLTQQARIDLLQIIEKLLQKGANPCEKTVQEKVASSVSEELRKLFEQYSMGCVMSNCAQSLSVLAVSMYDVK